MRGGERTGKEEIIVMLKETIMAIKHKQEHAIRSSSSQNTNSRIRVHLFTHCRGED